MQRPYLVFFIREDHTTCHWRKPCVLGEEDSRKAEIQTTEHLRNLNLFLITEAQVSFISCYLLFINKIIFIINLLTKIYKITIACFKLAISMGSTLTHVRYYLDDPVHLLVSCAKLWKRIKIMNVRTKFLAPLMGNEQSQFRAPTSFKLTNVGRSDSVQKDREILFRHKWELTDD